jgi:hypothetical protein
VTTSRESGATNSTSSGVAAAVKSSPGAQGTGPAQPLPRVVGVRDRRDDGHDEHGDAPPHATRYAEPRGDYALSEATSSSRGWSNSALKAATTSGSN